MSDNTLTGCWRLEQVGQHSSDEDDLFSSMKSRRYRGVRRVPSLCISQYGSAERLSKEQKTVPETQYWPTCRGRLRATLQLCWIAVQCKASLDELYTSRSEEHTSELQSHLNLVCRLLLGKTVCVSECVCGRVCISVCVCLCVRV